ncbi:Methyltransferase domain protein [Candidatus Methanoperedenaceae archaeon GB50]|nr:Methyltransferase domain protein [Candidatus Methanoperedenaceae archaeon GB50]
MKLSHKEITRIKETLEMIPSDVVSILEVGCGDGRITNSICHKYKLTGIDIDKERIKSFRGIKIIADACCLPFRDSHFDLVLAAEILEHLPEHIFYKTVCEINRVAKRYILVTVPYKEILPAQWLKCSKCGHIFHAWGHLRKFDLRMLKNLFEHTYLMKKNFYSKKAKIPSLLYVIAKKIGNVWESYSTNPARCPKCGANR